MRQRLNHFREVPECPRPTVGQDQGDGCAAGSALVQQVKRDPVHLAAKVRPSIHRGFVLTPVVLLDPVLGELTQVIARHTVCPTGPVGDVRPTVLRSRASSRSRRPWGMSIRNGFSGIAHRSAQSSSIPTNVGHRRSDALRRCQVEQPREHLDVQTGVELRVGELGRHPPWVTNIEKSLAMMAANR